MVDAGNAMVLVDSAKGIDRTGVESLALLGGVLNLQSSLDMFDGRREEAHCPSGHDASHSVAYGGEFVRRY